MRSSTSSSARVKAAGSRLAAANKGTTFCPGTMPTRPNRHACTAVREVPRTGPSKRTSSSTPVASSARSRMRCRASGWARRECTAFPAAATIVL